MAAVSLLELIERLLTDGDAAAEFREAPDQFLSDNGLGDLSGADVLDAPGVDEFGFGLGEVPGDSAFGAGGGDAETDADLLDLDLGLGLDTGLDSGDDLETATFDHGFGSGSSDLDVDHFGDVDDLD